MDLSTTYLGFRLPHPIMPGASPLVDDLDVVKRLEDAGAAAIVMHSLFEEQITRDDLGMVHHVLAHAEASAEAQSYFPRPDDFALGPDPYLEQIRRIKATVSVPVIGSLNGTTPDGWLRYAPLIQQAGADALELNFYHVATDVDEQGAQIEQRLLASVDRVRRSVTIPVAVKLSPFYSSLPHLAKQLDAAGADGLVLFNRFYQPDIDLEMLETVPRLRLSTSEDLLVRVRWLAILSGRVRAALIQHGPKHLATVRRELGRWLEQHDYESLRQAQGSMSLLRSPDPEAFERGNYLRALQTWKPYYLKS